MLSSISVFFPCFNEEKNIPELVDEACAFLPTLAKKFEILIIDDGSTDRTKAVVHKLQTTCPQLRLVSHEKNLGYGAALQTGIQHSKYDWIFWSDGDLQFDLKTLQGFLPFATEYDVIIGYRAHRADTFLRKVNGELYTQLINLLFGLKVKDIDCAFKLIKAVRLKGLAIKSSGAFTSAEILIRLRLAGVKIKQLPVPHFPRKAGKPTGGSLAVIVKGLYETIEFFVKQKILGT